MNPECSSPRWIVICQANGTLPCLRNAQQLTSRLLQCFCRFLRGFHSNDFADCLSTSMFSTFRCNNPNFFYFHWYCECQFQTFQTCENDCHSPTRLKGKIRALAEVLLKYFIEPECYYFICVWDCSSRLADDRTQNMEFLECLQH